MCYRPARRFLKDRGLSEPLLKVSQLYCERDDRVLFSHLDFALSAGEIVQIEGQNGSGKTTLLRILCGLSRNYEGEILWRGEPVQDVREQFCREMLYFGHQAGVKAELTPEENLRWYAALQPSIAAADIQAALERVGLRGYEDVPCHSLSAGQNRRVSLARLYLSRAPLWILDEPFTAIDKQGVAAKEKLLLEHARRGGSVILTTHHELGIEGPVRKINLDQLAGTSA
jgi:heme exporter protein A